jgi:hypothetical protein
MPELVRHCAVFGKRRQPVRDFKIGKTKPYAQYPVSVTILYVEPRKRRWMAATATPDNLTYFTIEDRGTVVYDSRKDVPCNMAEFEQTRLDMESYRSRWPAIKALPHRK